VTWEKELERVKRIVEQATDIRQERVEAAKLALKEGRLKLKVNDLAEKILADPLNQNGVPGATEKNSGSYLGTAVFSTISQGIMPRTLCLLARLAFYHLLELRSSRGFARFTVRLRPPNSC
jgi:hypothetical protein